MKKTILLVIGGFILGALISPIAGMAINSTRNLILGMAPEEAILTLADKIDEESGSNDEQEQKINQQDQSMENLKLQNEQQAQQLEEINQDRKAEKKQECESRISKAQDNLISGQRALVSDQKILDEALSGKCQDCYNPCVKLGNEEKYCKDLNDENLKNRKSDVQGDINNVKILETTLQNIKVECAGYL